MNPKSKITLTAVLILFVALTRAMAQFTYNAVDLGTLGGPTSTANSVDPSGQVGGFSLAADGSAHLFFYTNGTMNDLGALGGVGMIDPTTGNQNGALGSNAMGQVVGFAATSDGSIHAFLSANGQVTDLNTITNLSAGGFKVLTVAKAINDSSLIVGDGIMTTGDRHAFVLVPVGAATQGAPSVIPTKGGQWSYTNDKWVWAASDGGWWWEDNGWNWHGSGKPPTHHPHTPPPPPPPTTGGFPVVGHPRSPVFLRPGILLTPVAKKLTPPAPTSSPPQWWQPSGPSSPTPPVGKPAAPTTAPTSSPPQWWQLPHGPPSPTPQPPAWNKTPGLGKSPVTAQGGPLTPPAPTQPPASPAPSSTAQPTRGPVLNTPTPQPSETLRPRTKKATPTPSPHRHKATPTPSPKGPKPSPSPEKEEHHHHHP